jgi:hypothetical protein
MCCATRNILSRVALSILVLELMIVAATAQIANSQNFTYTLDRALFLTSTDWYLIDNFPPSLVNQNNDLIFRRFFFTYVDGAGPVAAAGLANTISFVCQRGHPNFLLLHLPEVASLRTIDRTQWISHTELRVRADNLTARVPAEYNRGEFFIDFTDETTPVLMELLGSRNLTIEFGSADERISLYLGDTHPDGKGDLKGFLRGVVAEVMKSMGGTNMQMFDTTAVFAICADHKRAPENPGIQNWVAIATVICSKCDPSQPGQRSMTITISKEGLHHKSEKECLATLKDFDRAKQAFEQNGMSAYLHCANMSEAERPPPNH